MCRSLADFFRYSIEKRQIVVPLQKEIEHVRTYLRIQEERFPDLRVDIEIPDELLPCPIIKLTLQPLLENAFTYGFLGEGDYGVRIWGEESEGNCEIFIEDNGEGMDAVKMERMNQLFSGFYSEDMETHEQDVKGAADSGEGDETSGNDSREADLTAVNRNQSTGIGLMNVHRRMRLMFGHPYGLQLFRSPGGGVTVQIALPWKNWRESP